MDTSSLSLPAMTVMAILSLVITVNTSEDNTCNACQCQFNNVQVLDQLIEAKVYTTLRNGTGTTSGNGISYTIWGKIACPSANGAELLYAGKAGGTWFSNSGGGVERLCLPDNPDYLPGTSGFSGSAHLYGAEYQFDTGPHTNVYQHNIPCAVCYVPIRATAVMIPAKTECPSSWTREYYGYLTSASDSHYRSSFTCLDVNPEVVPGSSGNINGALFYYSSSTCNGLNCPPYESNRILSCVVCTK